MEKEYDSLRAEYGSDIADRGISNVLDRFTTHGVSQTLQYYEPSNSYSYQSSVTSNSYDQDWKPAMSKKKCGMDVGSYKFKQEKWMQESSANWDYDLELYRAKVDDINDLLPVSKKAYEVAKMRESVTNNCIAPSERKPGYATQVKGLKDTIYEFDHGGSKWYWMNVYSDKYKDL